MKRFAFLLLSLSVSVLLSAQTVSFSLVPNAQGDLTEQVRSNLDTKLTQGLSKAGGLAGGSNGVFIVESKIVLGDIMKVDEGGVKVCNGRGELTLTVKNRIDESVYYSTVMPIRGNVMGDEVALQLDMIKRIKAADPLFVKFVTTSREKIIGYYKTNCSAIIQKAETMYRSKEYDKCLEYLKVIPESVGCYEQAAFLVEMCNNVEK